MASKKIREYDAKRIICNNIDQNQVEIAFSSVLISPETNLNTISQEHPWLNQNKLVVKPDQLFGKRKKHNLVLINASIEKVKEFIKSHRNKNVIIGKATDKLTNFLIEPFVSHEEEYYLAITSERDHDTIIFSEKGGIDVEENWGKTTQIKIPITKKIETTNLDLPEIKNQNHKENIIRFAKEIYKIYVKLNFTYLEINPFTIDQNNTIHLLDTVARIDNCAYYKNKEYWGNLQFPQAFGRSSLPEEEFIRSLDAKTGASLKLTILNPKGKVWNILSGGGASLIYLDEISKLIEVKEIANYGEYSGNPSTEESYQYSKTIIDLMTREENENNNLHIKTKTLFIAGAIANFTDVEKTFLGIIKALEECKEKLQQNNVKIFVRRGGPNWKKGIKLIKETAKKLKIDLTAYGPNKPMVEIIPEALQ